MIVITLKDILIVVTFYLLMCGYAFYLMCAKEKFSFKLVTGIIFLPAGLLYFLIFIMNKIKGDKSV